MAADAARLVLSPLMGGKLHELCLAPLRNHHALGLASRTGGIDHIRQVVGRGEVDVVGEGIVALTEIIVHEKNLALEVTEVTVGILLVEDRVRGDEHLALGVFQHVEQAVCRITVVERDVCASRLFDADSRHHELLLIAQHDADEGRLALADAHLHEVRGKGTREIVELGVSIVSALVHHGDVLRSLCCLAHEERGEGIVGIHVEMLAHRHGEDFLYLPGVYQRDIVQGLALAKFLRHIGYGMEQHLHVCLSVAHSVILDSETVACRIGEDGERQRELDSVLSQYPLLRTVVLRHTALISTHNLSVHLEAFHEVGIGEEVACITVLKNLVDILEEVRGMLLAFHTDGHG